MYQNALLYLGGLLLFLPKIGILEITGTTIPLRADDLIIAAAFPIVFALHYRFNRKISDIEKRFAIFFLFSIISFFVSRHWHDRSNILFALRHIEYFFFFYVGTQARNDWTRLLRIYLILNSVVVLLQSAGIIGGLTSLGYVYPMTERPAGLTGGPWELGILYNFYLGILISKNHSLQSIFLTFIWTGGVIAITGSRIPLLAHIILLGILLLKRRHNGGWLALPCLFLLVVFAVVLDVPIIDRFSAIFSMRTFDVFLLADVPQEIANFTNFEELVTPLADDGVTDYSWLIRATQWAAAWSIWIGNFYYYPLGIGPGVWGGSLDGAWLRLLTETGFIGLILFAVLFWRVSKISRTLWYFVVALGINMIFIDAYIAYKVMAVVWLFVGASVSGKLLILDKEARALHA